jgi:hypothetical protein
MRDIRPTALITFAAVFGACAPAVAGDWSGGCDVCQPRYYDSATTHYTQPTYTYAAPTVTVVPHVIVQPNYVVQRTYVVRQDQYVREVQSCWFGCESHRVVDQGQYPSWITQEPSQEYTAGNQADLYTDEGSRFYHHRSPRRHAVYYPHPVKSQSPRSSRVYWSHPAERYHSRSSRR